MKCNFTISMNETCPNRHIEFEANIENPNYDHLLVQSDADSLINAYYSPSNIESKRNHKVLILPGHSTKMFFESSYDTSL
uniref:Uncharacterized protein n=1 Tax=Panagrolaimus davidi TaxID=227884 RepID=A0A914PMM6_9BILA